MASASSSLSPLNLLHSCGTRSWGGLEIQTLKISHALTRRGHAVTLLCARDSALEEKARALGLAVQPLLDDDRHLPASIGRIRSLLKRESFQVVHTHLSHDLWALVPAVRLARRPLSLYLTKRMASSIRKTDPFHRWLYGRLDGIFTVSDFIRGNVIDTCPIAPSKVHTLRNGLVPAQYRPEDYDRQAVRREWGSDDQTVVVGLVGRMTPQKGHREFLRAARKIVAAGGGPLKFWVVGAASYGEDDYEQEVRELAKRLGLEDRVVFSGFREDVPRMMAGMDILAFPSYKESFPNTVLEGMAMGLPVVASGSGAVPEVVVAGETGLLVPPKSVDALAEALQSLIGDPVRREKFGRAGRARVEEQFTFERYLDDLEAAYRRALKTL